MAEDRTRTAAPGPADAAHPDAAHPDAAHPNPVLRPWSGFSVAASAAVQHLSDLIGLDLWLVLAVEDGRQRVVAAAGAWEDLTPPGMTYDWHESFCLRMLERRGPTVAPDVLDVPAYAAVAVGRLAVVRAYVGVPLETADGEFFGTLCGFAGEPQPDTLSSCLQSVQLVGRMLSTLLAHEHAVQARTEEVARAYALAERDPLTGLSNGQGWETALAQEDTRCQRYGATASVAVVQLTYAGDSPGVGSPADDELTDDEPADDQNGDQRLRLCAEQLTRTSRPGDVLAHVGAGQLTVLLLESGPVAAQALVVRLRVQLRTAGVAASYGAATRRTGERLHDTWQRAADAARSEARRRASGAARGRVREPARPARTRSAGRRLS